MTVAQRVGLNTPDHVAKAYQLLPFDIWFYEFTYKKGFPFANTYVKELINFFKENKKHAEKIVQEMKELATTSKSNKDIYKAAVQAVSTNENQCYNQSDIENFKNLDIDEITCTGEVPHTPKVIFDNKPKENFVGYAELNQTQRIKYAQKNLQIDINNGIIKDYSIGIVFKDETSEKMRDLIMNALKNCKLETTIIKTVDDLINFMENTNDDKPTLQQEDNQ